jgi:hypothetical protein
MMPDRDPGESILRLSERLAEEAAKVGLTLRQFAFVPNADGPHTVQCLFTTDGEAEPTDTEQARFDAQFDQMLADQARNERDEKVRRAKEQLEHGGGILDMLDDDDDTEPTT